MSLALPVLAFVSREVLEMESHEEIDTRPPLDACDSADHRPSCRAFQVRTIRDPALKAVVADAAA